MNKPIKPQKLDFFIAGQAIKARVYQGRAGKPVAEFSGLEDLNSRQLDAQALAALHTMFASLESACRQ